MGFKSINIVFEVIHGLNKMVRSHRIYMYTPVTHNQLKIPSISDSFGKAIGKKQIMDLGPKSKSTIVIYFETMY